MPVGIHEARPAKRITRQGTDQVQPVRTLRSRLAKARVQWRCRFLISACHLHVTQPAVRGEGSQSCHWLLRGLTRITGPSLVSTPLLPDSETTGPPARPVECTACQPLRRAVPARLARPTERLGRGSGRTDSMRPPTDTAGRLARPLLAIPVYRHCNPLPLDSHSDPFLSVLSP